MRASVANAIKDKLLARGKRLFEGGLSFESLSKDSLADALLNDLSRLPHAFVLACIMDRQIQAEKAWLIPYRISQRLGTFKFEALATLTISRIERLMTKPEPLHRFTSEMSRNFHNGIALIARKYGGVASKIWTGKPSSAEVVYRFLEFRGVGPKIATMAANILVRRFKVPLADYYSIDVSADVHVRRVFARLGFINVADPIEAVIYKARALHPEFPGLFDFPAWDIGRNWCRPSNPLCSDCYMNRVCPSSVR